ncbi:MAG: hypothetical protein ACOC2M_02995, partial [bacterium]
KELFDKLSPNAWILAHDTVHEGGGFPEQLKDYLKFVRNPKFFKESYSFPIDDYGLELSIKK